MGLLEIGPGDYSRLEIDGRPEAFLSKDTYDRFTPAILGLGDLAAPPTTTNAVCAVCDLEGFTALCSRPDSHLVVPEFLNQVLTWLFDRIKLSSAARAHTDGHIMNSPLPFFAKFMGDGVLLLWDTHGVEDRALWNVVSMMRENTKTYEHVLRPELSRTIAAVPRRLRCGIARGEVSSVGNGQDFVGPCMNMAARLQKLSLLSFAFARHAVNVEPYMSPLARASFVLKEVDIRGMGNDHLVYVLDDEFAGLPADERLHFRDP